MFRHDDRFQFRAFLERAEADIRVGAQRQPNDFAGKETAFVHDDIIAEDDFGQSGIGERIVSDRRHPVEMNDGSQIFRVLESVFSNRNAPFRKRQSSQIGTIGESVIADHRIRIGENHARQGFDTAERACADRGIFERNRLIRIIRRGENQFASVFADQVWRIFAR